ncbi:hypothetical protein ES288_A02G039800v1 [Gossypium darwinii]|uniref:Fe2OG dioxygenase domain-containing protein n=1 Tax=Gossypium darwinii TaxID=34276 RepID=A0A5D2HAG8_GOSDA|nr:hypothetical protein ES288_A02G039800v1 [Gossypium darwinii]
MDVDTKFEVPVIEFRSLDLERGTDEWHHLCKRVREACETYGCFEVVYEKISTELRNKMFGLMKDLVELPLERKQKNVSSIPYHGYIGPGSLFSLLNEGFGLVDASNHDSVKNFTQLMWPDDHAQFCDTVYTMATQIEELNKLIWLIIIDSNGLRGKWELVMKHWDYERGLHAHTDKSISTIIFDNQVSGLEIEVKDSQWIKLSIYPSSFVFVVGDTLKAWSNERLKVVNHRVIMNGYKNRLSIATFAIPIEGTIIKTPKELIDEQHPQLYKDFDCNLFYLFCFFHIKKIH